MTPTEMAKAGSAPLPRACAKPATATPKGTHINRTPVRVQHHHTTEPAELTYIGAKTVTPSQCIIGFACSFSAVWGLFELWMWAQ